MNILLLKKVIQYLYIRRLKAWVKKVRGKKLQFFERQLQIPNREHYGCLNFQFSLQTL